MFKQVVITSGPTIEPIDPVRFISNRSSGKTGYYLALEATARNCQKISFITGPTSFLPNNVDLVQVETTLEMRAKVLKRFNSADVVIMAAAVCDYKSHKYYSEKLKSSKGDISLKLVKNPDILMELGQKKRKNQILVGFAAETDNIFENAEEKFAAKNLDLLILNQISDENPAFDVDFNQVYFVTDNGMKKFDKMKKSQVAHHIWEEIGRIANNKGI
jgi:phosphopantothenoylcysteine decarboxylase/phosphopantothenate--cysteine ligase